MGNAATVKPSSPGVHISKTSGPGGQWPEKPAGRKPHKNSKRASKSRKSVNKLDLPGHRDADGKAVAPAPVGGNDGLPPGPQHIGSETDEASNTSPRDDEVEACMSGRLDGGPSFESSLDPSVSRTQEWPQRISDMLGSNESSSLGPPGAVLSGHCTPRSRPESSRTVASSKDLVRTQRSILSSVSTLADASAALTLLFQLIPFCGQDTPVEKRGSAERAVLGTLRQLPKDAMDSKDSDGNTLVMIACRHQAENILMELLGLDADTNAINNEGASALHFACSPDSYSATITRQLLNHQANPEVMDWSYGCTPLHWAASMGDCATCHLLVNAGASVITQDLYGYTPMNYALDAGFEKCAYELEARATINKEIEHSEFDEQQHPHHQYVQHPVSVPPPGTQQVAETQDIQTNSGVGTALPDIPEEKYHYGYALASYEAASEDEMALYESEAIRVLVAGNEHNGWWYGEKVDEAGTAYDSGWFPAQFVQVSTLPSYSSAPLTPASPCRPTELLSVGGGLFSPSAALHHPYLTLEIGAEQQADSASAGAGKAPGSSLAAPTDPAPALAASAEAATAPNELATISAAPPASPLGSPPACQLAVKGARPSATLASILQHSAAAATVPTPIVEEQQPMIEVEVMDQGKVGEDGETPEQEVVEATAAAEVVPVPAQGAGNTASEDVRAAKAAAAEAQQELEKMQLRHQELEAQLLKQQEDLDQASKEAATQAEASKAQILAHMEQLKESMRAQRRESEEEAQAAMTRQMQELESMRDRLEAERLETDMREQRLAQERKELEAKVESMATMVKDATARAGDAELELANARERETGTTKAHEEQLQHLHRELQSERQQRRSLHNTVVDLKGRIRVFVRVRNPCRQEENSSGETQRTELACTAEGYSTVSVTMPQRASILGANEARLDRKVWNFDKAFAPTAVQSDVYDEVAPLVTSCLDGFNVCVFAYGQTGSGKTYTMFGSNSGGDEGQGLAGDAGIVPRAIHDLFSRLATLPAQDSIRVEIQMLEVYRDAIQDVLGGTGDEFKVRVGAEGGVALSPEPVTKMARTPQEALAAVAMGVAKRSTNATKMNAQSSRSHLVARLAIHLGDAMGDVPAVTRMTFVDLAGSERIDRSGVTGTGLKEAQSINKSLSALADVVSALTSKAEHVPYRNHPLTMLMADSVGGNAKTLMIVCASPNQEDASETVNSLTFAKRCKGVANRGAPPAGRVGTAIRRTKA